MRVLSQAEIARCTKSRWPTTADGCFQLLTKNAPPKRGWRLVDPVGREWVHERTLPFFSASTTPCFVQIADSCEVCSLRNISRSDANVQLDRFLAVNRSI